MLFCSAGAPLRGRARHNGCPAVRSGCAMCGGGRAAAPAPLVLGRLGACPAAASGVRRSLQSVARSSVLVQNLLTAAADTPAEQLRQDGRAAPRQAGRRPREEHGRSDVRKAAR